MPGSPYLSLTILMHFQHILSLPAIHSAMPGSPYLSLTILMHFQHILSLPASHSAMPASPNLSRTHTASLPAPHSAMPASPNLSLNALPTLPLPAIPSLPCASLTRLAPHSVPLYLSLPFRLSPVLPSRALPRILVFQSHSTSPCQSFSPLRFPLAPCPAFWFSSPTLPLPAIPSLPCASLTRLAPHSGFPVPLYLSLPFRLSHALPSRALPRILVFQSHSTSPCHSFSPMRFPLAPCPAFWFSSPTLPLPAIPSLPCASLSRLAPHYGFPVPLYLSLPFRLSPALPSRALPRILVFQYLSLPFLLSHALPSRALPRILVFQSHSTSPCHSFSPMRFPLAPCPAFWFSSPTLPLPAIPSLPCASLTRLAPHSGFPVPLYLSLPFLLSPALPSRALPRILDRLGIGDIVATLILSSDETIADGRGKAKGHPIYMSLGNIHHEDRWKPYGHALIATLPEFPAEYTSVDRLQIFQYVLRLVLQPLKDASHV
ncbi:unnamed protein product [Closterium sp. NIES-64]|nr:unnamed protein product [Closterium sp. NIES-64]